MKILDYLETTDASKQAEVKRATLVCYYAYKENQVNSFSLNDISTLLQLAGYCAPNKSRLQMKVKANILAFAMSIS